MICIISGRVFPKRNLRSDRSRPNIYHVYCIDKESLYHPCALFKAPGLSMRSYRRIRNTLAQARTTRFDRSWRKGLSSWDSPRSEPALTAAGRIGWFSEMVETQDALMHKVGEFTQLVAAQSLKMIAQSKAMDAQSVLMTEQAVRLTELQGASEDAPHQEHKSRPPAPDARQGVHTVSASRHKAPKFHGEALQYPKWWKKLLSHFSMINCSEDAEPRAVPLLVGDERVRPASCDDDTPRVIRGGTRLGNSGRTVCFRPPVKQSLEGRVTGWLLEGCREVVLA